MPLENDSRRAAVNDLWTGIAAIGSSLVQRVDRLASDSSKNSARIESLEAKVNVLCVVVFALAVIILFRP